MKNHSPVFYFCLLFASAFVATGLVQELRAAEGESKFWSFRPVHSSPIPDVAQCDGLQSPVDPFILAKLQERGLNPAPVADKRILIRRATFDLTGMPPTPDEVDEFLLDESPDAFAKVVDRLLASPQYGARWGRHWLDVIRYADARDLIQLPAESDFREAWRYRDWVVSSFNRDLPYDQFIRLQIAGDLMQPDDASRIDAEALIATGMLAIADFVPGDVDKQQMIADYVNDQIDVVGRAVLGLTIACARCHDHKFDTISTEDYYSLAGIFFSTRLVPGPVAGNTPLVRVPLLPQQEIALLEAGAARDKARVVALSREIGLWGDREYRAYLERQVNSETQRYLLAAWEYFHSPVGQQRPLLAEFSASRKIDATILSRWIAYFDAKNPHPALSALSGASNGTEAERYAQQLTLKLSSFAAARPPVDPGESASTAFEESPALHFRADDRRVVLKDTREIVVWPNRGRFFENAVPVSGVAAPSMTTEATVDKDPAAQQSTSNGKIQPVLRFTGNELLQVPGPVPPVGSLVVVFRPDPAGTPGQRLVGWEDAAVGMHGLGIMTDAVGSVHAILRRNGANGDVVVPAPQLTPEMSGFQILCVTWGAQGVAVYRNGQPVGVNKGIDSVSSDPAITTLKIGGPGSGTNSKFRGDLAELRVYGQPLDDQARTRVESELMMRWFSVPENGAVIDPVKELYEELVSAQSPFLLEPAARDTVLTEESRQQLASLRTELESLQKKAPFVIPRAVVVQDGGPTGTPHEGFRDAQVYLRGNHKNPGKTVPRGFPVVIAGANPPTIREGSGRRELAQWLTRPENPLTPRVMVNRIWQHHFGVGLVATSANFGEMGERPSHPELLDELAARFVASGWSVKTMHRAIMLSNTYQQSSAPSAAGLAVDPENRLLWRVNRRRLEAEAVRDNLFAVAGRLDLTPDGIGFQDVAIPRRSLYLMSVRTGAKTAEFGPLFDAPDCSGIVERRSESIVAPQALFLMNDPLVSELGKSLGDRVNREAPGGNDVERIRRLYEIVFSRRPTDEEIEIGKQMLSDPTPTDPALLDKWNSYCRLIVSTNEFLFVD